MKTKKLQAFGIILILIFVKSTALAQDSSRNFKHAIGAAAGFTTGYGLSYRFMPAKYGVQITFAPYHDSNLDRFSTGLTLLYTLVESKVTNLFLYQGTHHYYNSRIEERYDPDKTTPTSVRVTESYVNVGLGVGIEIIIAKRVGFNLMAGYAAYDNFNKLNITGESGLFYKF